MDEREFRLVTTTGERRLTTDDGPMIVITDLEIKIDIDLFPWWIREGAARITDIKYTRLKGRFDGKEFEFFTPISRRSTDVIGIRFNGQEVFLRLPRQKVRQLMRKGIDEFLLTVLPLVKKLLKEST